MSLLLTVHKTSLWKRLAELTGLPLSNEAVLHATTATIVLEPIQSISTISALISEQSSEATVWLGVVQAEYFLADALENGQPLSDAAREWEQQTIQLLDLQRKQRKKLRLFNIHQALARPLQFSQLLSATVTINNYLEQTVKSNFLLLAACQYLAQHAELQTLNTRLQASALPLCESEKVSIDIDQVLMEQTSLLSAIADRDQLKTAINTRDNIIKKYENDIKVVTDERDLILAQLHQVQEQLEQYYLTLQAEQQQHKHALLARDKQQAKEQAKLEAELRKTKARAANAEYAVQLLQKELEKLRASISWKAATPVRMLGRLIKKNDPAREQLMQEIGLLLTSEYFDVDWYLRTYTDVAESQINPAEHYLLHGAAEGRLPGPLFDGNWYLQHYPDVAASNMNPLLHFVMYGQQEGRTSSPKLLTNNQNAEE